MTIDDCYLLGHIIKPHGLNGAVQLFLDVDSPEEYENLESVFVSIDNQLVPFFIDDIQVRGKKATVYFEGVEEIEKAESLRNCDLYLPLDLLPELPEGKFYYHEILGFEVLDKKLGKLGVVKEVNSQSSQALIVMEFKSREVLIPVNDDIIVHTDKSKGILEVDLPEGLLDIYLDND